MPQSNTPAKSLEMKREWIAALYFLGFNHSSPPAFIDPQTVALLVDNIGSKLGTIVFFSADDTRRYGAISVDRGYGCATAFNIQGDFDGLAEVLKEWNE